MKIARTSLALGLGIMAPAAHADDFAWKPAKGASHTVPAAPMPTAASGLVFGPPAGGFPPTPSFSPFHSTPLPSGPAEGSGLTWHTVSAPTPAQTAQAIPLPIPRPFPETMPPAAPTPPTTNPGPKIVPRLDPMPEVTPSAAGWSNQVWGTRSESGPIGHDGVVAEGFPPVPAIPVRHHALGSRNITLSRDYHFLDIFTAPFGDSSDNVYLGEGPPDYRSYIQAEYLLWWMRPGTIPVLASTSTNGGFGFTGDPGSQAIIGPGNFGSNFYDGMRLRAGTWFHDGGHGLDASFFFLGRRPDGVAVGSNTTPIITRPFFAPNPGVNGEFGEQVAFPGQSTGFLEVNTSSFLWGADINLLNCISRTCDSRSAWFLGFRHLNLDEGLSITEALTAGPMAPKPAGTTIIVGDSFSTRNRFYGPQFGWAVGRTSGRFDIDGRFSLALGATRQEIDINGFQAVTPPGGGTPMNFRGGLLAAGPNLGTFTRDRFSVVPEFTLNLGYMVTPRLRTYIGYNLIYWSDVVRPGEQIDRTVDLSFVPNAPAVPFSGQARPRPLFESSDLWIQGINFGMELRW